MHFNFNNSNHNLTTTIIDNRQRFHFHLSPIPSTTDCTSTTTDTTVQSLQDSTSTTAVCENTWDRRKCGRKLSQGKCRKYWVWSHCKATCRHCCGDVWTKNQCDRNKWSCNKKKTVRRNCRQTCNTCNAGGSYHEG